ncbi:uncharacterized protein LOC129944665 [Eupeodes corollae]|uniref:uncharacterized protein LOC129944665 n=1 Tax=Eupeodes corollae TaxID=290404 RepID=UPI0024930910|nr:uncharacterized protein LOC129944665 [Eupeodes corollae]XP_055910233.1 uncharacterized protein LOC129944665 [Eupeodes corollae]
MANPRKFSEKIALQKQKQAEGTAEFEKIMKEVFATKRDEPLSTSQQRIGCCLSPEQQQSSGGNSGGGIPIPGSGGGGGNGNGGSGSPTAYRESRGRSVGVGPMRRPSDRKTDRSPYSNQGIYLSPPSMDNNWRRSNSDSAIHQSLILGPENPIYGTSPQQQLYLQQQQYHPNQRSHSPAASVGHSPIAQRRKPQQHMVATQHSHSSSNLQQMQMQNQLNHHKLNHQQQQQQHQQNHQQQQQVQMNHHNMHPHQQSSMVKSSQLQFNACGPTNSVYKTLQEQAMAMANTGSLPDLTSVHFSNVPSPSPSAITQHNMRIEREQSQSPFSNQSYQTQQSQSQQQQQQQQQLHQQQQHSPGGGQSHLSFTNLPVMVNQSPNNISSTLHSSYGNLPTTGGGGGGGSISPATNNVATSSSNLTEYRNPQHHNPPSPAGSASPGLMVANSPHDLHNSAPNSPIRHNQHQQQQQYSDKNIQTYDRFSPSGDYSNGSNNLNPSFHNHFAEFSLVDTAAQSESQYIPTSLQQDLHSPHNSYSQSLQFDDSFFGHHQQFSTENGNGGSGSSKVVSGTNTNSGGNSGGDPYLSLSNQNSLNNCSSSNLGPSSNSGNAGGVVVVGSNNNNSSSCQTGGAGTASASCSPLHSPHSPNPHSPSNNNSNLVNDISSIAQQQQQQKSHHTNDGGGGGGGGMPNNTSSNMHNSTTPTSTTPNIPSIVFSDFSSTDYSKEIFDTLDLDLGQMDPAGLQMLSDPSSMIADPNIEDGFRRDLN